MQNILKRFMVKYGFKELVIWTTICILLEISNISINIGMKNIVGKGENIDFLLKSLSDSYYVYIIILVLIVQRMFKDSTLSIMPVKKSDVLKWVYVFLLLSIMYCSIIATLVYVVWFKVILIKSISILNIFTYVIQKMITVYVILITLILPAQIYFLINKKGMVNFFICFLLIELSSYDRVYSIVRNHGLINIILILVIINCSYALCLRIYDKYSIVK